jgi:hypothetical protein
LVEKGGEDFEERLTAEATPEVVECGPEIDTEVTDRGCGVMRGNKRVDGVEQE